MTTQIMINQVHCTECGGEPFSKHRHDMAWCECGGIAVDGGMSYLRRTGNMDNYYEMSVEWPKELADDIAAALEMHRDNKNGLGLACVIARVLRDNKYEIKETRDVNKNTSTDGVAV